METVTATSLQRAAGLEWSVTSRALPGQTVSGDHYLVAPSRDGFLIGVVDGLGHGDQATLAAHRAVDVLAGHSNESVIGLIQLCHRALRDTRGAAMTVLALNGHDGTATTLGIGNVEMMWVPANTGGPTKRQSALLRNGVVGYQLPALQVSTWALSPGDVVVFATDGVREDFGDTISPTEPLPQLVDRILAQKYRGTDDALVLGCRLLADHA